MKALLIVIGLSFVAAAYAADISTVPMPATEKPREIEGVGITERLGAQIDLNLEFKNEDGQVVPLRSLINGSRPAILGLVYYGCPNLCNFFMNGVNDSLKNVTWNPGKEFDVIYVSIDPKETPELAAKKKANMLKAYGRVETEKGWHYLTGSEANIKALAAQVGFAYHWDEATEQWAHNAGAIITTPLGQVSRYLYGIMFEPNTIRLSLVEAGKNKVGGLVDRILLFCYKYDPNHNKYSFYAMNIMRAGAGIMLFFMGLFFLPYWKRSRIFSKQGDSTI